MDLLPPCATPSEVAVTAARRAGCTVRPLSDIDDIARATALFDQVWQAPGVMPSNLTRAVQHAGGYAAGAFADDRMVGASVGFFGFGDDEHGTRRLILHSHVTGVSTPHRGIGLALKLHQRAWAAHQGVHAVTWTFDPLVARNAWFNLSKLGVRIRAYLVDHYGAMADGINAGDDSDRLLAWWPVEPAEPRTGSVADAPRIVLDRDARGRPIHVHEGWADAEDGSGLLLGAPPLGVRIPLEIEALRRADPDLARGWRTAVRDAFLAAEDRGYRATGMHRDGTYLLTRPTGVAS
ncbi:hypothetical protein BH23ACT9_BH23ACT9_08370 [soil metagenome]